MAIAPTGNIYRTLTFAGINSGDYGVYITGSGVFNAPKRAVEMITIPGRDGALVRDMGRFENIEVSYPAGIFAADEEAFSKAISDFRNALCSKIGYQQLTDEYNSGEYRMAVYKNGLEVDPAALVAGQFMITFECQPQRFLTGDTMVIGTGSTTLNNPTLFPSKPLLILNGYGDCEINGVTITVPNGTPVGEYIAMTGKTWRNRRNTDRIFANASMANLGDSMHFELNNAGSYTVMLVHELPLSDITGIQVDTITSNASVYFSAREYDEQAHIYIQLTLNEANYTLANSVSLTPIEATARLKITSTAYGTLYVEPRYMLSNSLAYEGLNQVNKAFRANGIVGMQPTPFSILPGWEDISIGTLYIDSTYPVNGTTYIDLDTGLTYKYIDGVKTPFYNGVIMPADLPVLKPGNNTVALDNTFTGATIHGRWWKV